MPRSAPAAVPESTLSSAVNAGVHPAVVDTALGAGAVAVPGVVAAGPDGTVGSLPPQAVAASSRQIESTRRVIMRRRLLRRDEVQPPLGPGGAPPSRERNGTLAV